MHCRISISEARQLTRLTQDQLATRAGLSRSNLAAIESGKRVASDDLRTRIISASGVRPVMYLAAHREEVLRLAANHRGSRVWVFGSVARSEDRVTSDIDLMVHFAPEATLRDHSELRQVLNRQLSWHFDVISDKAFSSAMRDVAREAVLL